MASIQPIGDSWRAQVARKGVRRSKVFVSREMAVAWADRVEDEIRLHGSSYTQRTCPDGAILISRVPQRVLRALDAVPYSLDEVLRAALPYVERAGIYFLIRKGEVTYIGQSVDVLHRIARHKREGRRFDAFTYFACPVDQLDHLEMMYLSAFLPEENISLAPQRTPLRPVRESFGDAGTDEFPALATPADVPESRALGMGSPAA